MKRILIGLTAAAMVLSCLAGCGNQDVSEVKSAQTSVQEQAPEQAQEPEQGQEPQSFSGEITVISREEGSGTRGAFVELLGIEDDEGDHTVETAEISNSTAVVSQTVSGNPKAIGYVSMGALNDTVKALSVDGVEPTVDNVKAGSYKISRPFEVCYREENLTELGKDFLDYIMSAEGQEIIASEGYIAVTDGGEHYTGSGMSGTLSLNGSTSVAPVMEVLAERYRSINPDVNIDIQQTGSGAGITATIDGACEIGMCSRGLKEEELAAGLTELTIAMDGIAVIINHENPTQSLTAEQIRQIFVGEITSWECLG